MISLSTLAAGSPFRVTSPPGKGDARVLSHVIKGQAVVGKAVGGAGAAGQYRGVEPCQVLAGSLGRLLEFLQLTPPSW